MRFWTSFLCILLLSGLVSAQQKKFLVSPNQEVVPLTKDAVQKIMSDYNKGRKKAQMGDCNAQPIYGFPPDKNSPDQNFGFYHNDICGEWFVVPADGSIDTVFFHTLGNVGPSPVIYPGSMDSTVYFRIFTSYITPTVGPGIRPGPYRPPCTSWGYWYNTGDNDQGVAGFREDATRSPYWIAHHTPGSPADLAWTTDSSWNPTNLIFGDWAPSFPPFGDAIWGLSGFRIDHIKPNSDIKVPMDALAELDVHQGDVIFIAFQCKSAIHLDAATQDVRFEIEASDQNAPYPSRDWKFYEHDSGPSGCAGITNTLIKRGWCPRGPLGTDDTAATACYNIWFSMTPTANTPPQLTEVDQVHYTLSHDPQVFDATIFDCDATKPARAGVANAYFRYRVNGAGTTNPWSTLPMGNTVGDQFEGTIPGQPDFSTIEYKVVAVDSTGSADSSGIYSYRVLNLESANYYRIDTISACSPSKIAGTGTLVDTAASKWFLPRTSGALSGTAASVSNARRDDGTQGPFPIGNGFVYFGDTMHYAWIGVNGAIALSKTATDTIDVNSDGYATTGYDFPTRQRISHQDTLHTTGYMPRAFIAPYWADWIYALDSVPGSGARTMFGHIRWFDDSTKFITEWDSIGAYIGTTLPNAQSTISTFRVVLHKNDNSVDFQYDAIGEAGYDTLNLIGLQSDTLYHPVAVGASPPFAFYNRLGFPSDTHIHDGLCVRWVPVVSTVAINDGWNLLSLPSVYSNNTVTYLYPPSISNAFTYNNGYTPVTTVNPGPAFWLKFSGAQVGEAVGRGVTTLDIPIVNGWNMIGSINVPLAVTSITADAGTGIVPGTTPFFSYSGGYSVAPSITPGLGYWVHATGAGFIHLNATGAAKISTPASELAGLAKITISDKANSSQSLYIGSGSIDAAKYDLPPQAPQGALDARFATNSMVTIFPTALDPTKRYEYPIEVSASKYPVTIKWSVPRAEAAGYSMVLKTDNGKILGTVAGTGKTMLTDANVKKVMIEVVQGSGLPKVFALGQNYPNPFNPTTQFTVDIPRSSQVEVSVYDILGRKIATLLNGETNAGYHTLEWDSHDTQGKVVASGMYFIRMNVPSEQFTATQKVMLLK